MLLPKAPPTVGSLPTPKIIITITRMMTSSSGPTPLINDNVVSFQDVFRQRLTAITVADDELVVSSTLTSADPDYTATPAAGGKEVRSRHGKLKRRASDTGFIPSVQ